MASSKKCAKQEYIRMSTKRSDRRFGLLNNCCLFEAAVFLARLPAQKRKIVHSWGASPRDSRDSGAGIVRNSGGTASVIAPTLSADRNFYLPDATGTALVDTLSSTISTNANIPPITLVHRVPGPNYTQYLLTWTVALSAPGTNCVGNTTVELDGIWTDPSGSANQSHQHRPGSDHDRCLRKRYHRSHHGWATDDHCET